jgi:endonuclease YncB( thermonuclease family)
MSNLFLLVLGTALTLVAQLSGSQHLASIPVIAEDDPASTVLPKTVDLRPAFDEFGLLQRRQGTRGTCSVFTTVEAVEFAQAKLAEKGSALSVEFANWAANEATGRNDDGDFFHNIIRGIEEYGICPDAMMPYAESFSNEIKPTGEATRKASEFRKLTKLEFHWIRHWSRTPGLSDDDIHAIKAVLAKGAPVCAGSYHSVLFVGYEDEPSLPGGGRFLIADSNLVEQDINYAEAKTRFSDLFWVSAGSGETQAAGLPTEPATTHKDTEQVGEITGKVIGITDGDTIDILTAEKTKIRIRFNGIDAPESGQPFGRNAKQFLSDHIGGKVVRVVTHGEDRYERTIGDVYADDSLVNLEIVKAGLAWHYVKYAPDDKALAAAEAEARAEKTGLWSDRRHVAPWDWRKLSKAERDKLR